MFITLGYNVEGMDQSPPWSQAIHSYTILGKTPRTPGIKPYAFPSWWKKITYLHWRFSSNLFQFVCMDHHCNIYNKPHCDLHSAQTTYLIAVFGGLLERTIFDLLLCMAHISTCIGANLKNYMRSGKDYSRTTI